MQQYDYSKGKNASDMAMVIDALALLYTDRPDAFGIVSSDADFTPLVMHLREKGAAVYGFGAKKTPEPFVNACSRFCSSTTRRGARTSDTTAPAKRDARAAPRELKQDAKLVTLLRNAVQAAEDDGLGRGQRGRPADRQPGVVRPAQLRLCDVEQAADCERAVRLCQ